MVNRFIGPRDAIGGDAIENGDIINHYNPETNIYSFRGDEFDIQKLVSGIEDIKRRCDEWLNRN